jgi:hypothetical protein
VPICRWCIPLLGLLLAAPAAAEDVAWREPLWLQPPGADAPVPVLLAAPLGWRPGDAAVVVIPDPGGPQALRDSLVQALLAAGTVVVELDPVAASVAVPALPPTPALDPAEQPAALRMALRLLRTESGAGLLVVLGLGQAGALALDAAAEPELAAAVALGPQPRFLAGTPPPAAERWPLRAGLLCGLLTDAMAGAVTARDCRAALLR